MQMPSPQSSIRKMQFSLTHPQDSVGGLGRTVRLTGADGAYPLQEGCQTGRKSGAWWSLIPGLPLTAWMNLDMKPDLWGHWMSVDMRLTSQEGRRSSHYQTVHIKYQLNTMALSHLGLQFLSFGQFSPRTCRWWQSASVCCSFFLLRTFAQPNFPRAQRAQIHGSMKLLGSP